MAAARRRRAETGAVVLLKGSRTLVAASRRRGLDQPDRQPRHGHRRHGRRADRSARRPAGPGARPLSTRPSLGVYLHGLAGDLAAAADGGARRSPPATCSTTCRPPSGAGRVATASREALADRCARRRRAPWARRSPRSWRRTACSSLPATWGAARRCWRRASRAGWGSIRGEVQSPTFTLIREHRGRARPARPRRPLPAGAGGGRQALGLEELLAGPGVKVVEWAGAAAVPVAGARWLELRRTRRAGGRSGDRDIRSSRRG